MDFDSNDDLNNLVRELVKPAGRASQELPWVEFKHNNANPHEIGEYLSALANAAALHGKPHAYLLWGIDDISHDIVGTEFTPSTAKQGNEPLENWLSRLLIPRVHFCFEIAEVNQLSVVVLKIDCASNRPIAFSGTEYIRVGTVKKALKDEPELERKLWRTFDRTPFEELIAAEQQDGHSVLQLLDCQAYFSLLHQPLPTSHEGILAKLAADRLIRQCSVNGWDITNLGAILFAKRLGDFLSLERKAMRVVQYSGKGRTDTIKEQSIDKGYAAGFKELIEYINDILPSNETIKGALRSTQPAFPELAVRELVANALIHQDFHVRGAGPMLEIFEDRIEITNPGKPLMNPDRFIDTRPQSRNDRLASLMRQFGICEERGSGIDKVVEIVERHQLPAPLFEALDGSTRSMLFVHKSLKDMDASERIRACYLHACLRYVTRQLMTNTTLRERFGVAERNRSTVSRLIKEAVKAKFIAPADPEAAPKLMHYLPYWHDGS